MSTSLQDDPTHTLSRDEFIRYSRQLMLDGIGEHGQIALKNATVAIIGLGGLGSPTSMYLAAAGVGHLLICDDDAVDKSNLHRQLLYREKDIALNKVDAAKQTLTSLNPNIVVETVNQKILSDGIPEKLGCSDLVIECSDNSDCRLTLNSFCVRHQIPLISASAVGWEGQISQFQFNRSTSPCLACMLSSDDEDPIENCASVGVIGPLLGTLGSLQALQAIQLLVSPALDYHGKLWRFDARKMRWLDLAISKSNQCPVCNEGSR